MLSAISLPKQEVYKVLRGALVAAAGALLTYGTQYVTGTDFGELTPVVVTGFAVFSNYVRKLLGM